MTELNYRPEITHPATLCMQPQYGGSLASDIVIDSLAAYDVPPYQLPTESHKASAADFAAYKGIHKMTGGGSGRSSKDASSGDSSSKGASSKTHATGTVAKYVPMQTAESTAKKLIKHHIRVMNSTIKDSVKKISITKKRIAKISKSTKKRSTVKKAADIFNQPLTIL
jgi:hypothetical protein